MTIDKEICYYCGGPATTREHVPPACLFPENKDLFKPNVDIGISIFRNNLITVPSCKTHNNDKSQDDEFLLSVLAGAVGNNVIAYFHNRTKVKRSLARKGPKGLDNIMKDRQAVKYTDKDGYTHDVYQGALDVDRLINCFEKIARGLYFEENRTVFKGECSVLIGFLKYNTDQMEKMKLVCEKLFENQSKNLVTKGSNPEIFTYQFGPVDQLGLIPLKMRFYEGTSVYAAFKPDGVARPYDLAMELIKAGIKTSVQVNATETVEFNQTSTLDGHE